MPLSWTNKGLCVVQSVHSHTGATKWAKVRTDRSHRNLGRNASFKINTSKPHGSVDIHSKLRGKSGQTIRLDTVRTEAQFCASYHLMQLELTWCKQTVCGMRSMGCRIYMYMKIESGTLWRPHFYDVFPGSV